MIEIHEDFNLKDYNSWKLEVFAEKACLPTTVEEIKQAQQWAQENSQPVTVLGGGTNVLISDQGVSGLLIILKNFKGVEVLEDKTNLKLKAKAGTPKFELMRHFMKYRLSPALFLSGLPGDVAGGVVMNAGVSEARTPREFCEVVESFEVLKPDNSIKTYNKDEITWVYRTSKGWQPGIITSVTLSWSLEKDLEIPKKVKEANMLRLSKQPLDQPSCGSTFRNPEGTSAGALIDQCGLKGFEIGGAQVSKKHANFLINTGTATATDFAQLIKHIQNVVLEQKNIQLQTEVKWLGNW
ncbi:MAG: UDP-N-acetylmuramate dehydrogenase [Bdellovibrionales bacterium]|nr:UDP-N-acetylmuramate dehydrogenase [Bdellovibrionales bacterium]